MALVLVGGDYMAPFSTATGQILLALPLGMMIAAVMWIRDLTKQVPGPRFLQPTPAGRAGPTPAALPAAPAGAGARIRAVVTAIETAALGAMAVTGGVVAAVAALRPAAPSLPATLGQVRAAPQLADPTPGPSAPTGRAGGRVGGRAVGRWLERLSGRVRRGGPGDHRADPGPGHRDPARAGAWSPCSPRPWPGWFLAVTGWPMPSSCPPWPGWSWQSIAWFVQEASLHDDADKLRAEFQAALTSYLALVALERQVRGSPVEALEEAARLGQGWPFQLISAELVRAEARGVPPWTGLRDLGERLGVERLRSLADIVAAAEDGAAVFSTLLAEARSLRAAELAAAQARANIVSEQLGQPLALLALANLVLGILPAMLRLLTS